MPPIQDDQEGIPDDTLLWHRVPPSSVIRNKDTGEEYASSGTFRDKDDAASVHIAALTTAQAIHAKYPGYKLLEFRAADARAAGCIVVRAPEFNDLSHALVMRRDNPPCFLTKKQAAAIRDASRLIHLDLGDLP